MITYTGDIFPAAVSGAIGTNLKVPLRISNNFNPVGGITATVTFDGSKLDYLSFDTVGTYSGGLGVITITETSGSLDIVDNGFYSQTGEMVWFYLVFRNTMSDTGQSSTVTVTEWEQEGECSLAKAGETVAASAIVSTPKYVADIYYQNNVSVVVGNYKDVFMQLTNNFYVDMNELENTTRAAFRPNGDAWIKLDTNVGTVSPVSNYWWRRRPGLQVQYKIVEQNPDEDSDSIPPSSTRVNVAKIRIKGKTAGTQAVDFRADGSGGSFYKEDSKLKAMSPAYTLHTTTDGSDGLFRTHSNTITITSGGYTSCPFVSVWNGRTFVEENTILTQSEYTADGIAVVDYYPLENQPRLGSDGMYRLRIEERENEVSYIDQIRLLRIYADRPVSVTPDGEFFYESEKILPVEAVDYKGIDVLEQVLGDDGDAYASGEPGWLVVSYVPDYDVSGRVFAGHVVAAKEPCPDEKLSPMDRLNRKLGPIQLRVSYRQADGEWVTMDATPPRDQNTPTFSRTDLQIQAGKRIDLKYEWEHRWVADELPLVVAAADAPKPLEILPLSAFHSKEGQVAKALTEGDNQFSILKKGESLEIHFPAGGRPNQRSTPYFVVAAKGYYTPFEGSEGVNLPTAFALHPNYPNPFNAGTQVSFALPVESRVDIGVFNVLGQLVRTLTSGTMPAGEHLLTWDGANDQGASVASGTYFVRMRAGDFEEKRKMTLLK